MIGMKTICIVQIIVKDVGNEKHQLINRGRNMKTLTLKAGNKLRFSDKKRSEKIIEVTDDEVIVERRIGCCCKQRLVSDSYPKSIVEDFEKRGILRFVS